MKIAIKFGSHLIVSLFLFYLIGLSLALLLIQNRWIDMRFDSEYVVLVSMGTGLWCYFIALFMNGAGFAWWKKIKASCTVIVASLIIILLTTLPASGLWTMPAYASRKALFLQDALSLVQMNISILIWLVLGIISVIVSSNHSLRFENGAPMEWKSFSGSTRAGVGLLFGLSGIFVLFYLGQSEFQYMINHASGVMAKADVQAFRDYLLSFGPLAAVVSGLLMVFQSVIAPLPAFVITFANGLLFGWFWGAVLSWSSAMAGAVLCFYLAKFLGRPVVEKIVTRTALEWADRFFNRYGRHAIFLARLVPIVSFDLVSYAAGLTSVRFWHFFWATGLGQLPATILYSYLGENATSTVKILFFLFTVVIALTVLGFLLKPKLQRSLSKKASVSNSE